MRADATPSVDRSRGCGKSAGWRFLATLAAKLPLHAVLLGLLASGVLAACRTPKRTPNPSFPVTHREARVDLARMEGDPHPLERPLVVVSGIGDPSISGNAILRAMGPAFAQSRPNLIVEVSFFHEHTFAGARQQLLREVAAALAVSIDDLPPCDVVAFSMGGLVVRDAAIPDDAGRRLPVHRLFTICTPHEGARLAGIPIGTPQSDDMRITSSFIARLAAARRDYELVCYARLDDITVGEEFCAPMGCDLWWVPTPDGEWAHLQAFSDERILADIARRLRGEGSLARPPAQPLPL